MTIRLGQLADLPVIKDCAYAAYELYVPRLGQKPPPMIADYEDQITQQTLHVLEDNAQIVGFIVFYPREDHIQIENVAVFPNLQGKHYGTKLIEHAEQQSKALGLNKVELFTNEKMTENLSFYPSRGYVEYGRWKEDGLNRIFYRKEF